MNAPEQRTNFAQYSHQQLYAMLYAGNPDSARNAAAAWNDTGNSLHDQANQLTRQLSGFAQNWTGGAADQYQTMVRDLIGGIQKVADTAYAMRDLAYEVADAQDTARAQMPTPVDVPSVPPATLALASAPIQVDAGTPAAVVAQIQQARASAIAAVQGQQQATAAADAAHAKAVQVMTTLAAAYASAQAAIPPAPDAATAPNLAATNAIQGGALTAAPLGAPGATTATDPLAVNLPWSRSGTPAGLPGTPADPTSGLTATDPAGAAQQDNPLFGGMFSAGVAAASAAVFGRFGSLIPKVPSFAGKSGNGKPADGSTTKGSDGVPAGTPKLGDRLAAAGGVKIGGGAGGLGGIKGGGVGVGGGTGVGGPAAPTPSAAPGMLGTGGGSVGGDVAAGVVGAAGVAARGTTGMPMMPMMPMSGMAGGDLGGGRRIPPWLVETEDVWGESSAVSPTVIGEEPDLGQNWVG